ncbi:RIP metalloprotease RseP [Salinisphaera hydrothermalis]|uniref:Zinc metalloprotease n=1 Tax=Salinisphaera hydrothermalis (strain C41B8) TaxID=1304275 RepID=A0A084IK10_SALHC|nr:RIP metalloprotease RseP [Salinisphaera hydrothermalis]KEZ77044.1 membrane-associated zinc metalloprotease [Salinisphaera hydrothermalis C41B8]
MTQWLISAAAFAVAIGILVSIHEFGHYWVARRLGVRVLRYSIGFGGRVVGWTSRKTGIEYWLAAIPLGGYVKMLDEREAPVPEAEKRYAFNRVHPWRRIAIVAAGPGVNILFAIAAYWLVLMLGVPGVKPILGTPKVDSPAAHAGLQAKDQVVSLANEPIDDWQDFRLALIERSLDGKPVQIAVKTPGGAERRLTLDLTNAPSDPDKLFQQLGLTLYQPPATPRIGRIESDSPASRSPLQAGDAVLSIDGQKVDSPQALVDAVRAHPGQQIDMTVRRDGRTRQISVRLATRKAEDGDQIGHLGAAITVDPSAWESMQTVRRLGPLAAIPAAVHKTWELSALSVRLIGRMVMGQISWHNVGGPIQIATYAGQTAQIGLVAFISFLAFISVNLALINLLPIPVLDGGHLLYYAIEWIRGRPLSEAVQAAGQQAGMVALLMLMALAFYNDILRLLG